MKSIVVAALFGILNVLGLVWTGATVQKERAQAVTMADLRQEVEGLKSDLKIEKEKRKAGFSDVVRYQTENNVYTKAIHDRVFSQNYGSKRMNCSTDVDTGYTSCIGN
jgi:hypothetical protein